MDIFSQKGDVEGPGNGAGMEGTPVEAVTPEAITQAPPPPAPAPSPPRSEPTTQELPSALEPELRRIIDTAVARVAAIELEAIREARELTQRSEQDARDALRFALDRAFNLINSLELMAATVSGMAEALKTELDDAIDALRNVPEPESALSRELAADAQPESEAPVAEAPIVEEPVVEEPEPLVRLAPLVRPAEPSPDATSESAEHEPAAHGPDANGGSKSDEPEREPVLAGAGDASPKPKRKGAVRRFFTRG